MNRKTSLAAALLFGVSLALSPDPVSADQGRGHGHAKAAEGAHASVKPKPKPKPKPRKADRPDADDRFVFDRGAHSRVIHDYVRAGSLPPGLAKRQSLPPGLAKQLRERGQLPPGLHKRWVGVPGDLAVRMPAIPPYYHRYFAGDDLLVVDSRDNTIAYLIRDVLR